MGEAKRRADAEADQDGRGIPRPRDPWCPACGSRRIRDVPTGELRERFPNIDCDWMGCRDCRAVWEPFPPLYARDVVCAEACDNCAFRPGSYEQEDPARWRDLMAKLRPDGTTDSYGMKRGRFYCHKGVPIDMTKGPGNFLFPQRPLLVDGEPLLRQDGSPVMVEDAGRMRSCVGYLRMIWAHNAKRQTA